MVLKQYHSGATACPCPASWACASCQGALTLVSFGMQFGNNTLRLTTRQTYQLHAVLKQDLKTVFSTVIKNMGTTLGACGDVNRNVLAPPVGLPGPSAYLSAFAFACWPCMLSSASPFGALPEGSTRVIHLFMR